MPRAPLPSEAASGTSVAPPAAARRWGRITAIALGVILLLVAALYAIVVIAFPPSRLARLLADEVTAATGRDFRIGGDLSISVVPTIAVRAEDIVLGNIEGGSRPEMARVRRAAFELSLEALLHGKVRILRVDVEDADLLLETDAAGRGNWQFTPRVAVERPAAAASGADATERAFKLDRLVLANMHIAYRDRAHPAARAIDIESLDLVAQGEQVELAAAIVAAGQHWKIDGHVGRLTSLLGDNADWPIDLRLAGEGAAVAVKGTIGTGARAGDASIDLTARLASAAALTPYAAGAASLPMPLELSATLRRSGSELRADPLHLSLAGAALAGRITLTTGAKAPRLDAELATRDVDLAKLMGSPAGAKGSAAPSSAPLFDSTQLPFTALPDLDLRLAFRIEHLTLPKLAPLSAVEGKLTTAPGRLALDDVRAGLAGGTVRGRASVTGTHDAAPKVALSIDAKSLSIPTLEAAAGRGNYFSSGKANLTADLTLAGSTPKSLAASANGDVLVSAADVTLASGTKALDRNVIVTLLQLLIPTQSSAKSLVVQCVVARLPLRRGVALVDRSIAMETHDIAVLASGKVNLVDQTIRLEFKPRVKKGLGLNPANLADLMVMSGPLQDPQVGVDVKGAARGAADVGVAVATSGVSLLVTRAVTAADAPACGQAATESAPAPTAAKPSHFFGRH